MFGNDEWLNQVIEDVIDPEREIVDPHHHLWPQPDMQYNIEQFLGDTSSGHNVVQTVFMECGAAYRTDGPDQFKPVGETEFVAEAAAISAEHSDTATIAALIAHADLRIADLDDVLDAHESAGNGLFRGIRHTGGYDPHPEALSIPGGAPPDLYAQDSFRRGVERLGARGLTFDTWLFHHQIPQYRDLAMAVPNTVMIFNHFGMPIGVGPYAEKKEEIFERWKVDVTELAKCPNVYAKLGGLAMPDMGYGWHERPIPPTSDEFVAAHSRWYEHAIACFGPERCMFESNFPVDRLSLSYRTLWNGLKKIGSKYSENDQQLMFCDVARQIYRI